MFALKQMMERYREKQRGLQLVFIDLKNAYDRVPRQEIWQCMREKGVPEKYVRSKKCMKEQEHRSEAVLVQQTECQ